MDFIDKIILIGISAIVAFASSWGAIKYKVKELKADYLELKAETEKNNQCLHDRITKANEKRDNLKDDLVSKVHEMNLKLTEIHTIVTNKK